MRRLLDLESTGLLLARSAVVSTGTAEHRTALRSQQQFLCNTTSHTHWLYIANVVNHQQKHATSFYESAVATAAPTPQALQGNSLCLVAQTPSAIQAQMKWSSGTILQTISTYHGLHSHKCLALQRCHWLAI